VAEPETASALEIERITELEAVAVTVTTPPERVTVAPGSVTVTVFPGFVTVMVFPGFVTVTVVPGAVTVTVTSPESQQPEQS